MLKPPGEFHKGSQFSGDIGGIEPRSIDQWTVSYKVGDKTITLIEGDLGQVKSDATVIGTDTK